MKQGDRVIIVGNHPWKSQSGTYVGDELVHLLGVQKHKIQLDNGFGCFADDKNIKVLK